jgi:hypothetical protein
LLHRGEHSITGRIHLSDSNFLKKFCLFEADAADAKQLTLQRDMKKIKAEGIVVSSFHTFCEIAVENHVEKSFQAGKTGPVSILLKN